MNLLTKFILRNVGKLFLLLTYLGSFPGVDSQYRDAADNSRRALMEYSFVKDEIKDLGDGAEQWSQRNLGLGKEEFIYAAYFYPLATGTITTKPFKNLSVKALGATIRPELEYHFYSKNYSGMLILIKEF